MNHAQRTNGKGTNQLFTFIIFLSSLFFVVHFLLFFFLTSFFYFTLTLQWENEENEAWMKRKEERRKEKRRNEERKKPKNKTSHPVTHEPLHIIGVKVMECVVSSRYVLFNEQREARKNGNRTNHTKRPKLIWRKHAFLSSLVFLILICGLLFLLFYTYIIRVRGCCVRGFVPCGSFTMEWVKRVEAWNEPQEQKNHEPSLC